MDLEGNRREYSSKELIELLKTVYSNPEAKERPTAYMEKEDLDEGWKLLEELFGEGWEERQEVEQEMFKRVTQRVLWMLNPLEIKVAMSRWFGMPKFKTQTEVAREIGRSRWTVGRIEKRIRSKIEPYPSNIDYIGGAVILASGFWERSSGN